MASVELPDSAWREFLRQPGETTFLPIYESCKGIAWTLCVRILGRNDDAMDAFQATWCRLLDEARNATAQLSSSDCKTVVYRLAIREAQNLRRRTHRRARKEIAVDTFDAVASHALPADEQAARTQLRDQLETLVRLLPEDLRLAVQLNLFHGLTQQEISRALELTQSTVSRRLSKGLKELEKMLNRAGLTEALKECASAGIGAFVLAPPEALTASIVFAKAQAALAAGTAVAAASSSVAAGSKISAGIALMKTKLGILAAIAALGVVTLTASHEIKSRSEAREQKVSATTQSATSQSAKPLPIAKTSPAPTRASSTQKSNISTLASSEHTTGATIVGQVIDNETKKPISGAAIEIKKCKGVSVDRGFYKISGVAGDQANAFATAKGYAKRTAVINIRNRQAVQNFALDPAVDVDVKVVDAKGDPVTSASIEATEIREGFVDDVGVTDIQGNAVVPAMSRLKPPKFSAKKVGYREAENQSRKIEINPEKTRGSIKLVLESVGDMTRVVSGKITDKQGKPVPKVTVQWSPVMGRQEGRDTVQTDTNGFYVLVFENEEKDCKLSVFGNGWAPAIREGVMTGTANNPATENFTLDHGHWLSGIVIDEAGNPIPAARVRSMPEGHIYDGWEYPNVERKTTCDASGKFWLADLSGPKVAFEVRGPKKSKFSELDIRLQPVDIDTSFTLKGIGAIAGRVIDKETGKPIPTFNVKTSGGGVSVDRVNPGESFTTADGSFVLKDLDRNCKFDLTFEAAGYIPIERKDVSSQPETKTTPMEVKLSRGHELKGYVMDSTNAPVKGALVDFGVWNGNSINWLDVAGARGLANAQKMTVDPSGEFRFKEDEPGAIFIQAKGYRHTIIRPEDRGKFQMNSDILWVRLEKGESIHGTYYQNGKPAKKPLFWLTCISPEPVQAMGDIEIRDDGTYECTDLAPGTYRLLSVWPLPQEISSGSTSASRNFEISPGDQKEVNFGDDLGPFTFKGRLTNTNGVPYDNLGLVIKPAFNWSYARFDTVISAGNGGQFTFPNLKPGRYLVETYGWSNGKPANIKQLPPIEITGDLNRDIQADGVK